MSDQSIVASAGPEGTLNLETDSVSRLVQEIWTSTLGLPVDATTNTDPNPSPSCTLLGSIQFRGAWQGAVHLHCSCDLAKKMAAKMFDTAPEALTKEDIHDALGELVNIIGGNLKAHLPPACQLQPPSVSVDNLPWGRSPDERLLNSVELTCETEPFRVSLVGIAEACHPAGIESRGEICKS